MTSAKRIASRRRRNFNPSSTSRQAGAKSLVIDQRLAKISKTLLEAANMQYLYYRAGMRLSRLAPMAQRYSATNLSAFCTSAPRFPDPRDPHQSPLADLSLEETQEELHRRATRRPVHPTYVREVNEDGDAFAIGRRKRSEAKVWLREGTGRIVINNRDWIDFFPRVDHRDKIIRPIDLLGMLGKMDLNCRVRGGGINGQSEALRLGIARAMQKWDPLMRPSLKRDGLLKRDSRIVESKKSGRKKARKSFQWVKR